MIFECIYIKSRTFLNLKNTNQIINLSVKSKSFNVTQVESPNKQFKSSLNDPGFKGSVYGLNSQSFVANDRCFNERLTLLSTTTLKNFKNTHKSIIFQDY
jgi:hypothetical protein